MGVLAGVTLNEPENWTETLAEGVEDSAKTIKFPW